MSDDDLALVRFFIQRVEGGFAAGVECDGKPNYDQTLYRTRRAAIRAARRLAADMYEFARAEGIEPRHATKQ